MHILLLGASNDTRDWFEGGKKRHEIAAVRLEAEYGEPVQVTVRAPWPKKNLPELIERWIDEAQPDIIYLNIVGYWFLYRSVPLRAQRILGSFGLPVGRIGFRMADSRRWSHNAIFRGLRGVLQRTIGGDRHFTADQVLERTAESLRVILRHEGVGIVLKGPQGKGHYAPSKRQERRDEVERLRVQHALEALAAQLHIPFVGSIEPLRRLPAYALGSTVGDHLHGTAELHAYEAEGLYHCLHLALDSIGYKAKPLASASA